MKAVLLYQDLTLAQKTYFFHQRHTQDIKAFLYFMAEHIAWLKEGKEKINIPCPCTGGPTWPELLDELHRDIGEHYDDYIERPTYFIDVMTKGKTQYFYLDCLQRYRDLTHNPLFKKAIQYWFDC